MMVPLGHAYHGLLGAGVVTGGAPTRTLPSFVASGTGDARGVDTNDHNLIVNGSAGDFLLLFIVNRVTAGTVDNLASIVSLGWTSRLTAANVGSNATIWVLSKFHDGSEPNVTITWTGANISVAQTFAYTNVDPTSPIDFTATPTGGTGITAIPMPTVGPTTVPNCLAVALVGGGPSPALAAATGASGGTWSESAAEFTTLSGNDGVIQAQHAALVSSGATISGGTTSTGGTSSNITVAGFALKGVLA